MLKQNWWRKLFIFDLLYVDMFGIEEYYDGLLEEAKSPEEIKKILEYQFVQGKGVPKDVLDAIFEIDPTKKKSYTRWVLMQWESSQKDIVNSLRSGRLRKMFNTFKERAGSGLDLTNMESFEKAMEYIPEVDPCLDKEGDPKSPENDFDILYESAEWIVAQPHTYEANRKLGKGCRWCTAGAFGNNDYYWNRYSPAGPIFVNFDKRNSEICPVDHKEYPYTRYQFLFEWQNWAGELMDSNDERVNFDEMDMPEDVKKFYGEQNPKYEEMIENGGGGDSEELWLEYNETRLEYAVTILNVDDMKYLVLMPEQNDDRNLNVEYMLYDDEDTSDSVFSTYFDGEDYFINRSRDWKAALLKDVEGRPRLVYWDGVSTPSRYHSDGNFELERIDNWWDVGGVTIAEDGTYIYFLPTKDSPDNDDIFCKVNYDTVANGGNILEIYLNKKISEFANENGIEGYYGIVFEALLKNGMHTLFMYDGESIIPMIRGDVPTNGEMLFIPEIEGNKILIQGERFRYKFGEGGEADDENISLYDELEEINGHKYCIVVVDNKSVYGVYDMSEKKMVLEPIYDSIEDKYWDDYVYLICTERGENSGDGNKSLFYLNECKFLLKDCAVILPLFKITRNSGKFLYAARGDSRKIFTFEGGFRPVCEIKEYRRELYSDRNSSYAIVEMKEGGLNVINLDTGKPTINDGPFINYGIFGEWTSLKMCILQKKEQKDANTANIYNYETGHLVCENYNIAFGRPRQYPWDMWLVSRGDKFNFITKNGSLLLPKYVDFIYNPTETRPVMIPIIDNNKLWLLDEHFDLLPTKDGIDLNVFGLEERVDYCKRPVLTYKGMKITLSPSSADKIKLLINPTAGFAYDDSTANEIQSLIFKQQAAIRESFIKTLDMLNNFYKDKN